LENINNIRDHQVLSVLHVLLENIKILKASRSARHVQTENTWILEVEVPLYLIAWRVAHAMMGSIAFSAVVQSLEYVLNVVLENIKIQLEHGIQPVQPMQRVEMASSVVLITKAIQVYAKNVLLVVSKE
jgi:hypothetical protein